MIHFDIKVNGESVGYVEIQRIGVCFCTEPDHEHDYRVTRIMNDQRGVYRFVQHVYGDGIVELVRKAVSDDAKGK